MKTVLTLLIAFALSGCATSSGILPEGKDSYLLTREGGSAFVGVTGLRTRVYKEAGEYCADQGKKMQVTSTSTRTGGLGVFPMAELRFMCLNADDAAYSHVQMVSDKAPVIQINQGR